jgi:flagellar hook protein FlgE
MTFEIALSGIDAAMTDLNTTANNISNASTTGFKGSTAQFAQLFAVSPQGTSATEVGSGVQVTDVAQDFSQGNVTFTNNNLDLALSGSGFFTMSKGGATSYTRDGTFSTDSNGYVVNAAGQRLQVYAPLSTGGFNTSSMTDLQVQANENAPAATTSATMSLNLPSNATAPATTPLNPADPTSYTDSTSVTLYDSLGAAHTGTLYFAQNATSGKWDTSLYVDGSPVGPSQQLSFSNAGVLTTPGTGNLTFPAYQPATGAAPMNMTFNFSKATQYGSSFAVNSATQNGYTTGALSGTSINSTGIVSAQYTNGQTAVLGQVALANFANPNGLQQGASNNWTATYSSGQVQYGQAGNSGLGVIQSGAVESSNVDITTQLVNMITAQRAFQANAQVISTANQVTQTIITMAQQG